MPYVIESKNPEKGVFVGHCMGFVFFANLDNAGQNHAVTFSCVEHIQQMCNDFGWNIDEFVIHEVEDGYYKTLIKNGINPGFLQENSMVASTVN